MRGRDDRSRYDMCKCISNKRMVCKMMALSLRPGDDLTRKTKQEEKDLYLVANCMQCLLESNAALFWESARTSTFHHTPCSSQASSLLFERGSS